MVRSGSWPPDRAASQTTRTDTTRSIGNIASSTIPNFTNRPFFRYGSTNGGGILHQRKPAIRKSSRRPRSTKRQRREMVPHATLCVTESLRRKGNGEDPGRLFEAHADYRSRARWERGNRSQASAPARVPFAFRPRWLRSDPPRRVSLGLDLRTRAQVESMSVSGAFDRRG